MRPVHPVFSAFLSMKISIAQSAEDFSAGKRLFLEYAESLDFSICFQNFEQELADIHVQYGAPNGCLLLVNEGENPVGCAGVRRWENDIAELKRMYLRPHTRGRGWGRLLLEAALEHARRLDYRRIRLDTVPTMQAAIALYRELGFAEIPAYRENPFAGTLYMEKTLF